MMPGFRVLWLASILGAGSMLCAQFGGTGTIQGLVTDPSGAVVPGATVTAENVATGVKTTRQTTAAGLYVIAPLVPGTYTVTASAAGFKPVVRERVVVDALTTVEINFRLEIGPTAEQVTVTDVLPPVNTADARMGQTLRNDVYTALPLAMGNAPRDPTAFVRLMPGITGTGGTYSAGNVLGAQPNSQEVYIEGLPLTDPAVQGEVRYLSLAVSVEAIDQFQLETANAPVQYGGAGGTNFVLKSGGNDFHGTVYEYFRNDKLDARGFFASRRPTHRQNEFGVNLSGPLVRNRIFFFGNYDGYRYRTQTQPAFYSIPTEPARQGDFSAFPVGIFDPATTDCSRGPCTRSPFPGNRIPRNRISPISDYFQSFLPPTTNSNLQNNYLGSVNVGYNNDSTTNKVDFYLNDRQQLYWLYTRGRRKQSTPYRYGTLPLPYADARKVVELPTSSQIRHTYVPTANLVNQLSFGVARFGGWIENVTMDGKHPQKAGLRGLPPGEADSSFPEISFSGPNSPTGWRGTNSRANEEVHNTFTLQDNLQWTRGRHALSVGFLMQRMQVNMKERRYGSLATWNFSNTQTAGFDSRGTLLTTTGNSYASYLLGYVNSATVIEDWVVGTGGRYRAYGWWLQDNWKVTPWLTLNLGLRYDIMTPYVEVRDRMSFFNPSVPNPAVGGYPGALMFAGYGPNSCMCRTPVKTYYNNFQPRLGLAWSLNPRTVLRAGYSISTTHRGAVGGRGGGRTGTGLLGYSAQASFTSLDGGISPAFDWDDGVPPYQKAPFFDPTLNTGFYVGRPQGGSVTYGDPLIGGHPPRYQYWSFGFQRALPFETTLGIHYVGNNGHYLDGGPRGMWSGHIHPKYLALGNLLRSSVTAAVLAQAQAQFPEISLPYPNFTGALSQMLRPFPQYAGVNDLWPMVGNSNFNSLQVTVDKRLSQGLIVNLNYTYGKGFDDLGFRNGYIKDKAQMTASPHILNVMFVYHLPFAEMGAIRASRWARALTQGWRVSGIFTHREGTGIGSVAASCNLPNAGSCYADYTPGFSGPVRINGPYGSGDLLGPNPPAFLDRNAFQNPAAFTFGTTPRTLAYGLRNPGQKNLDLSIRREFRLRESLKLSIQADAFNLPNWVMFSGPNTNITSAAFGRISSQANSPRAVQFSSRIEF
ncbi:MAG: TonB-dependent receptor [Bryobacterales bacterium]|nr:TonB-dependent receptor [Bryobacteraceae bacterium]MDW8131261.1 TonB-dependent receptor [Bryobacterales bacterium]